MPTSNSFFCAPLLLLAATMILATQHGCILQVLGAHISANPTSAAAQEYRSFVKSCLLPAALKVATLLEAHSAVMQMPPLEWFAEKFPIWANRTDGSGWRGVSPDNVLALWLHYVSAWEPVTIG
eukprot:SAG31_NODE_12201_length_959_cov_1.166279_1_plen_123_part_10